MGQGFRTEEEGFDGAAADDGLAHDVDDAVAGHVG
jgi:hypothetical protein